MFPFQCGVPCCFICVSVSLSLSFYFMNNTQRHWVPVGASILYHQIVFHRKICPNSYSKSEHKKMQCSKLLFFFVSTVESWQQLSKKQFSYCVLMFPSIVDKFWDSLFVIRMKSIKFESSEVKHFFTWLIFPGGYRIMRTNYQFIYDECRTMSQVMEFAHTDFYWLSYYVFAICEPLQTVQLTVTRWNNTCKKKL